MYDVNSNRIKKHDKNKVQVDDRKIPVDKNRNTNPITQNQS